MYFVSAWTCQKLSVSRFHVVFALQTFAWNRLFFLKYGWLLCVWQLWPLTQVLQLAPFVSTAGDMFSKIQGWQKLGQQWRLQRARIHDYQQGKLGGVQGQGWKRLGCSQGRRWMGCKHEPRACVGRMGVWKIVAKKLELCEHLQNCRWRLLSEPHFARHGH